MSWAAGAVLQPEVMGALPRMVNAERNEGIFRKWRIRGRKESRVTYRFLVCDVLYEGMEEPRQIGGEGRLSLEMWSLRYLWISR